MRKNIFIILLLILLTSARMALAVLPPLQFKRINPEKTLIGQEHTAQDQEMIDEPGRASGPTEHRWEKLNAFVEDFKARMKVIKKSAVRKRKYEEDPGFYIKTKAYGEYRVNMEPVTIEVNSPPPNIFQLKKYAAPIYDSFAAIGLTPYIRPAAERSGMGHAHIGGAILRESPFFIYPNLLPNLMAYLHNNPAALFALSEAYDMGRDSNMETYHFAEKQKEFVNSIEEFHRWYLENPKKVASQGLATFVKIMKKTDLEPTEHYRYINFERLGKLKLSPKAERLEQEELTAATVEVRVIRPYKSAEQAEAVGYYLLKLLDYLSDPNLLIKPNTVSREDFQFYYSGSVIAENWKQIKKEISFEHPLVEEMVNEYVENVRDRLFTSRGLPAGSELSAAYSRKDEKGKRFEVRIPQAAVGEVAPDLALNGFRIPLRKVSAEKQVYWVGVFHVEDFGLRSKEITEGRAEFLIGSPAKGLPLREIKKNRGLKKTPSPSSAESSTLNFEPPLSPEKRTSASWVESLEKIRQQISDNENLEREDVKNIKIYASRAENEFFAGELDPVILKYFLSSNNLFLRLRAYLQLATQANFAPTELELLAISKGLQNQSFSDAQMKFSLISSQLLLKYRSKSSLVQEELRATALHESDENIATMALAAYLANGGTRDNRIIAAVDSVLSKLSLRQKSEEVERMKSFFNASLGRTSLKPKSNIKAKIRSCSLVLNR